MTKQDALELVQALRQTAVFGLVLRESCSPSLTASVIRGKSFGFEHEGAVKASLRLDLLADMLEDMRSRPILMSNLRLLLMHSLVRDSFEIVKAYAEETGQRDRLRQWGPYDFTRFVRNTFSHRDGAVLHQWSPPTLSSARWRDRVLFPTDVGKVLALEPAEYIELQGDLYAFLLDELS